MCWFSWFLSAKFSTKKQGWRQNNFATKYTNKYKLNWTTHDLTCVRWIFQTVTFAGHVLLFQTKLCCNYGKRGNERVFLYSHIHLLFRFVQTKAICTCEDHPALIKTEQIIYQIKHFHRNLYRWEILHARCLAYRHRCLVQHVFSLKIDLFSSDYCLLFFMQKKRFCLLYI